MTNVEAHMTKERPSPSHPDSGSNVAETPAPGGGASQKRFRLAIAAAVVVVLAAAVLWPCEFPVRQTARELFYLDLPFEQVRRILVLTEATDDILTLGDTGDLKEYTWIERPSFLQLVSAVGSKLNLVAKATMKVQTVNEEYVGSHLITLNQNIDIRDDYLNSAIVLEKGTERLHGYQNITRFSRDGTRTKVETSVTLGILVTAPSLARGYACGRLRANAENKVASQVRAIRQVIEANKDKRLPSFPFGAGGR